MLCLYPLFNGVPLVCRAANLIDCCRVNRHRASVTTTFVVLLLVGNGSTELTAVMLHLGLAALLVYSITPLGYFVEREGCATSVCHLSDFPQALGTLGGAPAPET